MLGVSLGLELTVPWVVANPIPIAPGHVPLGPREPVADFPGKHAHPADPERTHHRV